MEGRLNKPLALAMIVVALILGVLLGVTSGLAARIFGGPNPKTIATSSLESMRAQNRLIAFVARYVSVVSSHQERLGGLVSSSARCSCPATCATSSISPSSSLTTSRGTPASKTLRVNLPEIEIAGPDVDLAAAREFGEGGVLSALTNADQELDQANRAKAVADLRKQAQAACRCGWRDRRHGRRSNAASRCR